MKFLLEKTLFSFTSQDIGAHLVEDLHRSSKNFMMKVPIRESKLFLSHLTDHQKTC